MSVAILLARLASAMTREERIAFHREQQCSIGFAGLKPVRRVFVEV